MTERKRVMIGLLLACAVLFLLIGYPQLRVSLEKAPVQADAAYIGSWVGQGEQATIVLRSDHTGSVDVISGTKFDGVWRSGPRGEIKWSISDDGQRIYLSNAEGNTTFLVRSHWFTLQFVTYFGDPDETDSEFVFQKDD